MNTKTEKTWRQTFKNVFGSYLIYGATLGMIVGFIIVRNCFKTCDNILNYSCGWFVIISVSVLFLMPYVSFKKCKMRKELKPLLSDEDYKRIVGRNK